jgi:hypothetical protein
MNDRLAINHAREIHFAGSSYAKPSLNFPEPPPAPPRIVDHAYIEAFIRTFALCEMDSFDWLEMMGIPNVPADDFTPEMLREMARAWQTSETDVNKVAGCHFWRLMESWAHCAAKNE